MKIVYTTGVFDILHRGHMNVLLEAKKRGDHLVVGVQDDQGVFASKNRYPILSTAERVAQLESLPFVDEVIVYNGVDQRPHLERIKPNFMVQGDDWHNSGDRKAVIKYAKENNIELELIPYTKEISSSEIRRRVLVAERDDRDFVLHNVKLMTIADLFLYEKYEEKKVCKLVEKLRNDEVFFNPLTINEHNIVIDGVNRLEALKRIGAKYVTCLVVDYKDVDLVPNTHYEKDGKITRMSEFGDATGKKIEFPAYTKEDIIEMVRKGEMVENGATWHKVRTAVVRLKISLSCLVEGCDFDAFLEKMIAEGNIRYYPANVYICDEWL